MLSDALYRLRAVFRRNTVESELDEELSFHLEQQAEKYRRSGMAPDEVARRIRMEFGGAEQIREECRDARGTRLLEDCAQDLRYASRTLRKNPLFAAAAVITLALGIGASTAIFSVTDGVMLKALPYKDPDRLVLATRDLPKRDVQDYPMSSLDFLDVRYGSRDIFEDLAAIEVTTQNAVLPGADTMPEQVRVQSATSNLLPMLGAAVEAGRSFEEADGEPAEGHPVAVMLSYEYWQRRYAGDRSVVGTTIPAIAASGAKVVGVLAPGFELLLPPKLNIDRAPDLWVSLPLNYDNGQRNGPSLQMVGRLRKGVTLDQARTGANAVAAKLEQQFPVKRASGFIIRVEPMRKSLVAEVRTALLALMGAVIFLLLIACANVANLLLVRTSLRGRELAVRASLGGSLSRLMRQMLTEALLLSAFGALFGVGLAWVGIRELLFLAPSTPGLANLPRLESVSIDLRTLGFAVFACFASAAIYGVVPAWRASRPKVEHMLRANRRMGSAQGAWGGSRMFRNSVVAAEVALSFVLLVGSGLMFRSFLALRAIDLGFDPDRILTFRLSGGRTSDEHAALRDLRTRLAALPGVEAVTSSSALPLAGGAPPIRWGTMNEDPSAIAGAADYQSVLPGYFETLGTKLIAGRTFTEADQERESRVVVIDTMLAERAFPGPVQAAVGKPIVLGVSGVAERFEIIGVVAHQRNTSLVESGREQIYRVNSNTVAGQWAIRTTDNPAWQEGAIRLQIAKSDPRLLITETQPMRAFLDRAEAKTRFSLLLLGVFAVIAALLAGIGIYGVLSALVRQQTKEIGLRMALGAPPSSMFRFVAGQGLLLSGAGLSIGLAASLGLTRGLASMLVSVKPADPATFASTVALFLAIAFVASWLPARRAANLDPAAALRED
jgi:putative ABC transport system permease protein